MCLLSRNRNTPGQINMLALHTHSETYIRPRTQSFLSFLVSQHPPTTVWLSTVGGKKWPITMETVCAVLLQLWCMWWHFWPSGELYNAGAVQSPDRPWLPCLSCRYSVSYRCTVNFIWAGHHDNRFSGKIPSRQDPSRIPLSWKQNKISTKSLWTPVCCNNRNTRYYRDYVFCDERTCYNTLLTWRMRQIVNNRIILFTFTSHCKGYFLVSNIQCSSTKASNVADGYREISVTFTVLTWKVTAVCFGFKEDSRFVWP